MLIFQVSFENLSHISNKIDVIGEKRTRKRKGSTDRRLKEIFKPTLLICIF